MARITLSRNLVIWGSLFAGLIVVLGAKDWESGWLLPKPPLELEGKPALFFIVKYRGCECEIFVNDNARAQVEGWPAEARQNVPLHEINIDWRSDLAKQYRVIRAPTLFLLDASGAEVWRQDGVRDDEYPLKIETVQDQINQLSGMNP